jgi:hypothetical protein
VTVPLEQPSRPVEGSACVAVPPAAADRGDESAGPTRPLFRGSRWPDAAGLVWLSVISFFYLSPALKDGGQFVPADIGRSYSLLTKLLPHSPPLHNDINSDIVTESLPWEIFNWRTVHSGVLPLWDGLAATGLPQLFNFQSAPLALPSVVSYIVPLSWISLTIVAIKLLIAGSGVYICARVLGSGALGATFSASTFMLSGAFAGWLGWAISGPLAWSGWILAAIIVCARSSSRGHVWPVFLLGVVVAFSLYGGFPEASLLMAIGLAVAVGTAALCRVYRGHRDARGAMRVGVGVLAGGALAAPLLLPALSVIRSAARNGNVNDGGLSFHLASLLFAQGYDGLPIQGSISWQNYYESAAYVGVIAIVLALIGVMLGWRRPAVAGLVVGTGVCFLTIYRLGPWGPVQRIYGDLGLSSVALQRLQAVLAMFLALLAGLGLHQLVRALTTRRVRVALAVASTTVAAVIGVLWIGVGRVRLSRANLAEYRTPPSKVELEAIRRASLFWPTASMAFVLILALVVILSKNSSEHSLMRLARRTAIALIAIQSAFLVFAGNGINSYAQVAYPVTSAVASLRQIVGSNLLGLDSGNVDCRSVSPSRHGRCGVRDWEDNGFYPEINVVYGVKELALYDPTIPQSYFDAWPVLDAAQVSKKVDLFAPDIDTVALARYYGVRYVLALPGEPPPHGMRQVARIAGQSLYSVPGSSQFSFNATAMDATVLASSQPSDNRYVITVRVRRPEVLVSRITAVTGWHAVANGRGLPVRGSNGDFLSIEVPAGTTSISLYYWPRSFSVGLLLAATTLAGFIVWTITAVIRRRHPRWPVESPGRECAL